MLNLFKILADSTRLRLLRILRQGDFTVQDLMQILVMGQSRISRHLKLLSEGGLLQVEKQGTWHYYRLASSDNFFDDLWPFIDLQLNHLPEYEHDVAGVSQVMAERRQRSQHFFDQHARDWDHIHVDLLALPDYKVELLSLVPEGGLIVEVGVGSGALLSELAKRADRVVGIDYSPSMVALARETVAQHGLSESVEVRLAEMNHLPLAAETVQTVVLNQVLHHAEHPAMVFHEIKRILKADGLLVLADLTRHDHDWTRDQLADQWLGFNREEIESWFVEVGMGLTSYRVIGNNSRQQTVLLLTASIRP